MNYDIHITNAAQWDLLNAADYIEFVLKNPKAANDLLDEAEKQINSLSDFPKNFVWLTTRFYHRGVSDMLL